MAMPAHRRHAPGAAGLGANDAAGRISMAAHVSAMSQSADGVHDDRATSRTRRPASPSMIIETPAAPSASARLYLPHRPGCHRSDRTAQQDHPRPWNTRSATCGPGRPGSPQREPIAVQDSALLRISRALSRCQSRAAMAWRLSAFLRPSPTPSSTLATPRSLKWISQRHERQALAGSWRRSARRSASSSAAACAARAARSGTARRPGIPGCSS